jgi:hypothetical protein
MANTPLCCAATRLHRAYRLACLLINQMASLVETQLALPTCSCSDVLRVFNMSASPQAAMVTSCGNDLWRHAVLLSAAY